MSPILHPPRRGAAALGPLGPPPTWSGDSSCISVLLKAGREATSSTGAEISETREVKKREGLLIYTSDGRG